MLLQRTSHLALSQGDLHSSVYFKHIYVQVVTLTPALIMSAEPGGIANRRFSVFCNRVMWGILSPSLSTSEDGWMSIFLNCKYPDVHLPREILVEPAYFGVFREYQ